MFRQIFINNVRTALAPGHGINSNSTSVWVINTPALNRVHFYGDTDYALLTLCKISTGETEVIKVYRAVNGATRPDIDPDPQTVSFTILQRDCEPMVDGRVNGIISVDPEDSDVFFGITAETLSRSLRSDALGVSLKPNGRGLPGGMRRVGRSIASYGLLPQLHPYPVPKNSFTEGGGLMGIALSNPFELASVANNWQPNHYYDHGEIISVQIYGVAIQFMRIDSAFPYDDFIDYLPSQSGTTEPIWEQEPINDGGGSWLRLSSDTNQFTCEFEGYAMVASVFVFMENVWQLSSPPVITITEAQSATPIVNAQTLSGAANGRWWRFDNPSGKLSSSLTLTLNTPAVANSFKVRLGFTGALMRNFP